jgi:hypothetical protein
MHIQTFCAFSQLFAMHEWACECTYLRDCVSASLPEGRLDIQCRFLAEPCLDGAFHTWVAECNVDAGLACASYSCHGRSFIATIHYAAIWSDVVAAYRMGRARFPLPGLGADHNAENEGIP